MGTPIEDVHHGHGQGFGVDAAHIAEQGLAGFLGSGVGHGQGDTKNGVGTELFLVGCAVNLEHHLVNQRLIGDMMALQLIVKGGIDIVDGLRHPLAQVLLLVSIAHLHGFMHTSGCTRRYGSPSKNAAVRDYFCFYCRISP